MKESRATNTVQSTRNTSRWKLIKTNYISTVHAKIPVRTGLWVLGIYAQRILVLVPVSSCPDRSWKWNRQPRKWAKKQASIQENKQNMTRHHRANADKQIWTQTSTKRGVWTRSCIDEKNHGEKNQHKILRRTTVEPWSLKSRGPQNIVSISIMLLRWNDDAAMLHDTVDGQNLANGEWARPHTSIGCLLLVLVPKIPSN